MYVVIGPKYIRLVLFQLAFVVLVFRHTEDKFHQKKPYVPMGRSVAAFFEQAKLQRRNTTLEYL